MPTLPEESTKSALDDAFVTASNMLPVASPHTVSLEDGVEVPMPSWSVLSVRVTSPPLSSNPPPVAEIGAIMAPVK